MTFDPLKFHLGPLEITGYGIMMMLGFLAGGWVMQAELRRRKLDDEYSSDIVVAGVIGGIVGARLWYVGLTGDINALFGRSGLVWYGGFLGATAAILLNGWRKSIPWRFTTELGSPAVALGYALGRIGCFLVQDDYGAPTTLPWGMKFPNGLPPTTAASLQANYGIAVAPGTQPGDVLAVHPTQLYETAMMLLVFGILWRLRGHRHATGWLFGLYLILAGCERFLVEIVRLKDDRFFGALSLAQVTSIGLVAAGAAVMLKFRRPDGWDPGSVSALRVPPAA